jgi:hypothetical protein
MNPERYRVYMSLVAAKDECLPPPEPGRENLRVYAGRQRRFPRPEGEGSDALKNQAAISAAACFVNTH